MTGRQLAHVHRTLDLNKEYTIRVNQIDGNFSVIVNGDVVWTVQSGNAEFTDVKFYQSNNWHKSAHYDPHQNQGENIIELSKLRVKGGVGQGKNNELLAHD